METRNGSGWGDGVSDNDSDMLIKVTEIVKYIYMDN